MWKLFVRLAGTTTMIHIPNMDVSSAPNGYGHRGTEVDKRGFTLMSSVLSHLHSKKFIDYTINTFGEDAEIVEVVIKFEDIL